MPEWLRGAGAFMIAASELSGFADHGGQLYPPAFPWYVLGTAGQASGGPGPGGAAGLPTTTDALVTHAPVDSAFISQCNALGIRCLCYVTYGYGPPSVVVPSSVAGVPDLASPAYMGVQFGPVWWEKNADGTVRADNRFPGDGVGIQFGTVPSVGVPVPCPNTKSYVQAMLSSTRRTLLQLTASQGVVEFVQHEKRPTTEVGLGEAPGERIAGKEQSWRRRLSASS